MTNSHIIELYDAGLISWNEMQTSLRENGYQMTQVSAAGEYRLMSIKPILAY